MTATERPRASRATWFATATVTLVVLGPLLVQGGFALRGDMVFVPDQPWKPAWLGLDGSAPRAVPMDALVSLVDEVVPGALLQRLLLVAAFLAGGFGVSRLVRAFHPLACAAGVVEFLWNPWVHERLAIGQWAAVLGYGMFPWVVLAAARARDARPRGWAATLLLLVLTAVCAPSMGVLGALVATAVVATAGKARQILAVLGLAALANLPWILPGLLGPSLRGSADQFSAFAARGESALGTFASLVSMGGIWKSSVVPAERTEVVVVAVAGIMALAFVLAFRYAVPALGRRTAVGIALAGGVSLLIALLPSIGPVGRALGSLGTDWGALGILRDSNRYLAPFGLLLAVGAAALVDRLLARARSGQVGLGALAAVVGLAPVLLLPSLVWGLAGAVRPVDYPADWSRVAERVSGHTGAVVVLPWTGSYRGFGWNDHRALLDPATRFLPGDVLADDRVFLHDRVLPGEDPFLARIANALGADRPSDRLRALGVRWVLVEKGNGVREAEVPAGTVVLDGTSLTLVDLGPPTRDLGHLRAGPPRGIVLLGDIAVVLAMGVSALQGPRQRLPTGRYPRVMSVGRVLGRGRQGGSTT